MYFRAVLLALLLLGVVYISWMHRKRVQPKPLPPPAVLQTKEPLPMLDPQELEAVHQAAKDADPSVRWTAIELMYRLHDPEFLPTLRSTLSLDVEPGVRKKALDLLKDAAQKQATNSAGAMDELFTALKDSDKDVRIAALLALGEIGDKRAIAQVTAMINDIEPAVRLQALHTLSRVQQKRQADYEKLSRELRAAYEAVNQGRQKTRPGRDDILGVGYYGFGN